MLNLSSMEIDGEDGGDGYSTAFNTEKNLLAIDDYATAEDYTYAISRNNDSENVRDFLLIFHFMFLIQNNF